MTIYKIGNITVHIHGNVNQKNLEEATEKFLKAILFVHVSDRLPEMSANLNQNISVATHQTPMHICGFCCQTQIHICHSNSYKKNCAVNSYLITMRLL